MRWRERLWGSCGGRFPGSEKAALIGLGRGRFFSGVGKEGVWGWGSDYGGGGDGLGFGCVGCLTPNHATCWIGASVLGFVSFSGCYFAANRTGVLSYS